MLKSKNKHFHGNTKENCEKYLDYQTNILEMLEEKEAVSAYFILHDEKFPKSAFPMGCKCICEFTKDDQFIIFQTENLQKETNKFSVATFKLSDIQEIHLDIEKIIGFTMITMNTPDVYPDAMIRLRYNDEREHTFSTDCLDVLEVLHDLYKQKITVSDKLQLFLT